jgi:hypothetical protein
MIGSFWRIRKRLHKLSDLLAFSAMPFVANRVRLYLEIAERAFVHRRISDRVFRAAELHRLDPAFPRMNLTLDVHAFRLTLEIDARRAARWVAVIILLIHLAFRTFAASDHGICSID